MGASQGGKKGAYGIWPALVLILLLFLPQQAFPGQEKGTPVPFVAGIDQDGVQRVAVLGGGYFFRPNHIRVKVNVPVELSVSKEPGIIPHDITMKSPEAGMDFTQELTTESKAIRFTPTKTGSFPFYCAKKSLFSSHREKGMEGVIEVVP